jgi:hypothetical protein
MPASRGAPTERPVCQDEVSGSGPDGGPGVGAWLEMVLPSALKGARYPAVLAKWAAPPAAEDRDRPLLALVAAPDDMTACAPFHLPTNTTGVAMAVAGVARRGGCTFVDKARRIQEAVSKRVLWGGQ